MVAVPPDTPVITPVEELTEAMEELLLVQTPAGISGYLTMTIPEPPLPPPGPY